MVRPRRVEGFQLIQAALQVWRWRGGIRAGRRRGAVRASSRLLFTARVISSVRSGRVRYSVMPRRMAALSTSGESCCTNKMMGMEGIAAQQVGGEIQAGDVIELFTHHHQRGDVHVQRLECAGAVADDLHVIAHGFKNPVQQE